MKMKISWFVIVLIPSVLGEETFLYCGKAKAGRLVTVPKKADCEFDHFDRLSKGTVGVWVPTHPVESVVGYKCHVFQHTICTFEGFFGGRGVTKDNTHLLPVSPQDCHDAAQSLRWKEHSLLNVGPRMWTNNDTVKAEWSYCCREHCVCGENFILEKGSISAQDERTAISDLVDLTSCNFGRGWCSLPDAVVIWTLEEAYFPCPFEYKGQYDAVFHDQYIVVPALNAAFTPVTPPILANSTCLPEPGFHTSQGPYLHTTHGKWYLDRMNQQQSGRGKNQHGPYLTSLDTDPVDAKLEFIYASILKDQEEGRLHLFRLHCQVTQHHLDLIHQLLVFDPTLGIRALLANDSIVAKWVGPDVLLVSTCEDMIVDKVHDDHRLHGECFEFLPVEAKGRVYFVVPGTRELVLRSAKVPCALIHPTVRFVKGQGWKSAKGSARVATIPLHAVWNYAWQLPVFNAAPIFHTKEEDVMHENIAVVRAVADETTRLRAHLDRLVEYTSTFSVDPEGIANTIEKVGEGTGNFITSGFNKIIGGPIQALLNTILTIAIIVGVGYLSYKIIRCYLGRRKHRSSGSITDTATNRGCGQGDGCRVTYVPPGNQLV